MRTCKGMLLKVLDLYCASIGLNARFALPRKEGGKESLLVGKYSVLGKFSGPKTFSKIVALIV